MESYNSDQKPRIDFGSMKHISKGSASFKLDLYWIIKQLKLMHLERLIKFYRNS